MRHHDKARRAVTLAYNACARHGYAGIAWTHARCAAYALARGDYREAIVSARRATTAARRLPATHATS